MKSYCPVRAQEHETTYCELTDHNVFGTFPVDHCNCRLDYFSYPVYQCFEKFLKQCLSSQKNIKSLRLKVFCVCMYTLGYCVKGCKHWGICWKGCTHWDICFKGCVHWGTYLFQRLCALDVFVWKTDNEAKVERFNCFNNTYELHSLHWSYSYSTNAIFNYNSRFCQ